MSLAPSTQAPRVARRRAAARGGIRAALGLLLSGAAALPLAVPATADPVTAGAGGYVVLVDDGADPAALAARVDRLPGAEVKHLYTEAVRGFSAELPAARAAALRRAPDVAAVVPDLRMHVAQSPGGPAVQTVPTGVRRVGADRSAARAGDGAGAVSADVAVLDTGITPGTDLDVAGGVNCVTPGASSIDDNGHGTHVAGIIAAADDGDGVVGVAPGARLWSVKVLDGEGSGTVSSAICGLEWVARNAARIEVANLSFSAYYPGPRPACGGGADPLHDAVCDAIAAGVTVVVAAGNERVDVADVIPAGYPEVLTVSAFGDLDGRPGGRGGASCREGEGDDRLTSFTSYGAGIDLTAPGLCILSTSPTGTRVASGTSMAAPHVSGAAALYLATCGAHAGPTRVRAWLRARGDTSWSGGDPDGVREPLIDASADCARPAVFRSGRWFLGAPLGTRSEAGFVYGREPGDRPVTGDWNGDGAVGVGIFRRGRWLLRDHHSGGAPSVATFAFGIPTDIPVAGDWDGDGDDTVGVYRRGVWYLRNAHSAGPAISFHWGRPGDVPVVGDFDGDGRDSVGVVRAGVWILRPDAGWTGARFAYGRAGDRPVVGDWNGDGRDTIGVWRGGVWLVRDAVGPGAVTARFAYGRAPTDQPLVWRAAGAHVAARAAAARRAGRR